jgi:hypothetical protein
MATALMMPGSTLPIASKTSGDRPLCLVVVPGFVAPWGFVAVVLGFAATVAGWLVALCRPFPGCWRGDLMASLLDYLPGISRAGVAGLG